MGAEIPEHYFCCIGLVRLVSRPDQVQDQVKMVPIEECVDTFNPAQSVLCSRLFTFFHMWSSVGRYQWRQSCAITASGSYSDTRISFVKSCTGADALCWVWCLQCRDQRTKRTSYLVPPSSIKCEGRDKVITVDAVQNGCGGVVYGAT